MFRTMPFACLMIVLALVGCTAGADSDEDKGLILLRLTANDTVVDELDMRVAPAAYQEILALRGQANLTPSADCDSGTVRTGFQLVERGESVVEAAFCATPVDSDAYFAAVVADVEREAFDHPDSEVGSSSQAAIINWPSCRSDLACVMCRNGSDYYCCIYGGGGWECILLY